MNDTTTRDAEHTARADAAAQDAWDAADDAARHTAATAAEPNGGSGDPAAEEHTRTARGHAIDATKAANEGRHDDAEHHAAAAWDAAAEAMWAAMAATIAARENR